MTWLVAGIGALIVVAGMLFLVMMTRRKRLKGHALRSVRAAWRHALGQQNPVLRVVEADKVLDEALRLLGYTGSLGDKLKAAGPRFKNLNELWSAHKLRNTLVHELNSNPNTGEVERAIRIYEKALGDLGLS